MARELSPHEVTTLIRVERASGVYAPKSEKGKRTARKLVKRGYLTREEEYGSTIYYITRRGANKARSLWREKHGKKKTVQRAVAEQKRILNAALRRSRG